MKKKKKIFIIILIVLLFAIAVCFTVKKVFFQKSSSDTNNNITDNEVNQLLTKDDVKKEVDTLISNVLALDEAFSGNSLSESVVSKNDYGDDCYHYTGKNPDKMIELVKDVYYDSGHGMFVFGTTSIEGKQINNLYVCQPSTCTKEKIDTSEFTIDNFDENLVFIKFNNNYYTLKYDSDNKLKFFDYVCNYKSS